MKMRRALSLSLLVGLPLIAAVAISAAEAPDFKADSKRPRDLGPLMNKVERNNRQFWDVNVARNQGWVEATPCVSGPNEGAMGVHFLKPPPTKYDPDPLADGILDGAHPEALIYEPLGGGWFRFVGVEFIQLADDWYKRHPEGGVPDVDGHSMNLVGAPNRYGLGAFFELHVWAFEQNPKGSFSDWNTHVKCDRQPRPVS
jgi:hypothetical protein